MIAGALAIFQVRRHIPKTNSGFQVRILMCGSVPQNNMKPSRFMYITTSRDAVGEHNCAHLIAQRTNWKKPNMRKHPQMQEHGFFVVSGDLRTHRILAQFQIVTETIRFDGTSRECRAESCWARECMYRRYAANMSRPDRNRVLVCRFLVCAEICAPQYLHPLLLFSCCTWISSFSQKSLGNTAFSQTGGNT